VLLPIVAVGNLHTSFALSAVFCSGVIILSLDVTEEQMMNWWMECTVRCTLDVGGLHNKCWLVFGMMCACSACVIL